MIDVVVGLIVANIFNMHARRKFRRLEGCNSGRNVVFLEIGTLLC